MPLQVSTLSPVPRTYWNMLRSSKEKVLDAIILKHSNKMKVDEVKGDTIVSESKTLSPLKNEIDLVINIVYIPVWEIQGKQNTIDINAYDGHTLETPVDDDAEFV